MSGRGHRAGAVMTQRTRESGGFGLSWEDRVRPGRLDPALSDRTAGRRSVPAALVVAAVFRRFPFLDSSLRTALPSQC